MNRIISFASLLLAAAMLSVSCGEKNGPDTSESPLVVTVDKPVIKSDGTDAALITVSLDGVPVTEGVTFYDEDFNVVEIEGFRFTSTQNGSYVMFASYMAYNSEPFMIEAIPTDVPAAVEDKPEDAPNASFGRKMLAIQFTGHNCGFCPNMTNAFSDAKVKHAGKFVHTAVHVPTYSTSVTRLDTPVATSFGVNTYPSFLVDMTYVSNNYVDLDNTLETRWAEGTGYADAGIAVNSKVEGEYHVATVTVKAAKNAPYRVGAWLLEDGIKVDQTFAAQGVTERPGYDYDTHNNVVRVADSKYKVGDYTGYALGNLKKGECAAKTFVMKMKTSSSYEFPWKVENMHLVVFVVTLDSRGNYSVCNAVDVPVNEVTYFNYAD